MPRGVPVPKSFLVGAFQTTKAVVTHPIALLALGAVFEDTVKDVSKKIGLTQALANAGAVALQSPMRLAGFVRPTPAPGPKALPPAPPAGAAAAPPVAVGAANPPHGQPGHVHEGCNACQIKARTAAAAAAPPVAVAGATKVGDAMTDQVNLDMKVVAQDANAAIWMQRATAQFGVPAPLSDADQTYLAGLPGGNWTRAEWDQYASKALSSLSRPTPDQFPGNPAAFNACWEAWILYAQRYYVRHEYARRGATAQKRRDVVTLDRVKHWDRDKQRQALQRAHDRAQAVIQRDRDYYKAQISALRARIAASGANAQLQAQLTTLTNHQAALSSIQSQLFAAAPGTNDAMDSVNLAIAQNPPQLQQVVQAQLAMQAQPQVVQVVQAAPLAPVPGTPAAVSSVYEQSTTAVSEPAQGPVVVQQPTVVEQTVAASQPASMAVPGQFIGTNPAGQPIDAFGNIATTYLPQDAQAMYAALQQAGQGQPAGPTLPLDPNGSGLYTADGVNFFQDAAGQIPVAAPAGGLQLDSNSGLYTDGQGNYFNDAAGQSPAQDPNALQGVYEDDGPDQVFSIQGVQNDDPASVFGSDDPQGEAATVVWEDLADGVSTPATALIAAFDDMSATSFPPGTPATAIFDDLAGVDCGCG